MCLWGVQFGSMHVQPQVGSHVLLDCDSGQLGALRRVGREPAQLGP